MGSNKIGVYTPLNPGWLTNKVGDEYIGDAYYKILDFYVVNTICERLSCKGRNVKDMGWDKNVWQSTALRHKLYDTIKCGRGEKEFIYFVKKHDNMQAGVNSMKLDKSFHSQSEEKILVYQENSLSQMESVFYHIRNAFAHGRFQIYNRNNQNIYVMESGIKKDKELLLKARMILKESTLLEWIEILQNPIPSNK